MALATGHWQQHTGTHNNEGVFNSPWPAKKFSAVDHNQPIAIMGSSLSAVDGILTLAHNAGDFEAKSRQGEPLALSFTPHADTQNFSIDVYSRHGNLPNVLGYPGKSFGLAVPEFTKNIKTEKGHIQLDGLFENIKKILPEIFDQAGIEEPELLEKMQHQASLEAALQTLQDQYAGMSAVEKLRIQMNRALHSIETKTPLPEEVLAKALPSIIEAHYPNFSAEDQQRYMKEIHPFIAQYAYGMVMSNAQDVLALMEADKLHVHPVGHEYSLGTKTTDSNQKLPGLEIRYTSPSGEPVDTHHNVFVHATGDNMRQLSKSSRLMKSLFDYGIAEDITFSYADPTIGQQHFDEQKNNPAAPETIKKKSGAYHYSAGGMRLSHNNEVISSDRGNRVSGIFALGPPAAGYNVLLQGIDPIRKAAETIISEVMERSREMEYSVQVLSLADYLLAIIPDGTDEYEKTLIKKDIENQSNTKDKPIKFIEQGELSPDILAMIAKRTAGRSL